MTSSLSWLSLLKLKVLMQVFLEDIDHLLMFLLHVNRTLKWNFKQDAWLLFIEFTFYKHRYLIIHLLIGISFIHLQRHIFQSSHNRALKMRMKDNGFLHGPNDYLFIHWRLLSDSCWFQWPCFMWLNVHNDRRTAPTTVNNEFRQKEWRQLLLQWKRKEFITVSDTFIEMKLLCVWKKKLYLV